MSFQNGDKVSFINEKQDGYIVAIKADGTCVVEIEDGFTLDASPRELVKIKEADNKTNFSPEEIKEEKAAVKEVLPDLLTTLHLDGTVALIAIPDNGKVLSGKVFYHLVNGSAYDVLYVFSAFKSRMPEGKSAGIIAAKSSKELFSFQREELIDFDHLSVEILFHKEGLHSPIPRISKEIKIEVPTLTQNFAKAPAPVSFSIVHQLINFEITVEPDMQDLFQKYIDDNELQKKSSKSFSPSNSNSSKKNDDALKRAGLTPALSEVDLHIEELVEDFSGISAAEMLDIQLKHFRKELDRAMYGHASKIVFIHGVGNGRLKNAVRNELRSLKINFRDGAYDRYGAGATEVLLK